MKKRSIVIIMLIIFLFFIIVGLRLGYLSIVKGDYYKEILKEKTEIYLEGTSAPRGRILDCNGKVLVDNVGVKTIVYNNLKNITLKEEVEIAYSLAKYLEFEYQENINDTKKFWLLLNEEKGNNLITEEEYQLLEERKLSSDDIKNLKYERITNDILDDFDLVDKEAAYIYSLMNRGYSYEKKIILEDVDDVEYAKVMESKIKGITGEMAWKRIYPYGDTLKTVLGSIGPIPKEDKEIYLKNHYNLNDLVGISYLEKQYEEYLKGKKALYKVNKDNTLSVINSAEKGNDLVLSIDIDIQINAEEILKEQILKAKSDINTEYYKESYVVVSEPLTGALKSMAGFRLVGNKNNYSWQDVTTNIINNSYTPGSVVKAASMTVGYQNNLIDTGKKIKDGCVKLYLVPQKCSYKSLGYLDDIGALRNSSNYYQFMIAINLAGENYKSNMKLNVSKEHFDIYRNTFASFGLGVKTGIDLPDEKVGIIGNKVAGDLLLNLSIGQYDTYTPIELVQYINTVANDGKRIAPSLMASVVNNNSDVILKNEYKVLNTVGLNKEYFKRIKTGLNEVMINGTGRGNIDKVYNPAGKTGTSESFYDSNSDGISDVSTISSLFIGFAPLDKPKYSIVVISPNVSHNNGKITYKSKVNRYISKLVTDFLFENY